MPWPWPNGASTDPRLWEGRQLGSPETAHPPWHPTHARWDRGGPLSSRSGGVSATPPTRAPAAGCLSSPPRDRRRPKTPSCCFVGYVSFGSGLVSVVGVVLALLRILRLLLSHPCWRRGGREILRTVCLRPSGQVCSMWLIHFLWASPHLSGPGRAPSRSSLARTPCDRQ